MQHYLFKELEPVILVGGEHHHCGYLVGGSDPEQLGDYLEVHLSLLEISGWGDAYI